MQNVGADSSEDEIGQDPASSPYKHIGYSKSVGPHISSPPRLAKFRNAYQRRRNPSPDLDTASDNSTSQYSNESEIVTPMDIQALRQLPKSRQIVMADVKKEQAQKVLKKNSSSGKDTEDIVKTIKVCENVKTLHQGSPPYVPDYHRAMTNSLDQQIEEDPLLAKADADDELQASTERSKITDKELPATPKRKKKLRNKKSFAKFRTALNQDKVDNGPSESKSQTESEGTSNGPEHIKSPRKGKSFANLRKAFKPDETRDLHRTISDLFKAKTGITSIGVTAVDKPKIVQIPARPKNVQKLARAKPSDHSSLSGEYFDAPRFPPSDDHASVKSQQNYATSSKSSVLEVPKIASKKPASDPGASSEGRVAANTPKAGSPLGQRVFTTMKDRRLSSLQDQPPAYDSTWPLTANEPSSSRSVSLPVEEPPMPIKDRRQQDPTIQSSLKIQDFPSRSTSLPSQEPPSPERERRPSQGSINSSDYSGDENSVFVAQAIRLEPMEGVHAPRTTRAHLEGYE